MIVKKLLIVTPDCALAEYLYLTLQTPTTVVKLASDGVAAARAIVDWRPNVAVVDERVAGVAGWSLAELMTVDPLQQTIKLIMLGDAGSDAVSIRGVDVVARNVPFEQLAEQLLGMLKEPLTDRSHRPEKLPILADVLPIVRMNLGGIPSLAGEKTPSDPVRSPRSKALARKQVGTQSPRICQPRRSGGVPAPAVVAPRLSRGEYYLLDAAFAEFDSGPHGNSPSVGQSS